ncbi:DUF1444 domain-containing protein [Alkalihalobacterium chitinilyticum]|uniref:UPF0354 protein N7Z68_21195 n=1 Tax=Alkalihalobacterium chitinilyticum TaxID=2980103 RepID=A0ABT5VK94_9BACI|nr:DUF1444 domain-containing protein [Alkalihalobacterium chitinilyticum]MDE5415870.1 DUF1444 domain-containing protein [Alkalihalobacterium chitinilyticum]
MDLHMLRETLEKRLERPEWTINYDQDEDRLRIENKDIRKGANVALKPLLTKYERVKDEAIEEAVRYVEITLTAMERDISLDGREKDIFPVIRGTSFPTETRDGKKLVFDEHTAETRVFYSIDMGSYYTLIDEDMLERNKYTLKTIREVALFNVRSLTHSLKEDQVAENTFYFLNTNDGYDASRILDESLLEKMKQKAKGTLAVAVPHQDVLIFADIINDTGYDVLGQMVFQFFTQGRNPITALPFIYENGELEPTFILAQRKPKH